MYKLLFLLIAIGMIISMKAQSYDNKGIVLAGGTYQNTSNVLDWSMGMEVSVQSYPYANQALFTTGILQGNPSLLSNTKIRYVPALHLIIGPQPAEHFIYLRLNQPEVVIQEMRIFNTQSILVYQKREPISGTNLNVQINIDAFSPGVFFLIMDYTIESKIQGQQIFKLIKN